MPDGQMLDIKLSFYRPRLAVQIQNSKTKWKLSGAGEVAK